jgi:type IV secretory pathway protease TraF
VKAESAALARARGYLGPEACEGGIQPVLKLVAAVAGDVVGIGPDAMAVNGQLLAASSTAGWDSRGLDPACGVGTTRRPCRSALAPEYTHS